MKKTKKNISLYTRAKDDSKLYNVITNITETLRYVGYKDDMIKKYLISEVQQIIKEV